MQEVKEAERNSLIFKGNLDVPFMNLRIWGKVGRPRLSRLSLMMYWRCVQEESFFIWQGDEEGEEKGGEEEDLYMLPVRL